MARGRDDFKSLSGAKKAAIFMLGIGPDQASKLFEMMSNEEIKDLSQHMSELGTIDSNIVERLFVEFADQLSGASSSLTGSFQSTERLLRGALDSDRLSSILDEISGPAGRTMWDKMENVNETVLANYFKNEYPQTVAVVLSKVSAEHAAKVISLFPENFALEVITRMLRMEAVQKEVLDSVERTLRTEFMANLARSAQRDSHELMADIFNSLDRNTESRFMTALEERNRESAEKIKSLMFTFDDLERLDNAGIQTLMRGVGKEQLTLALKGAGDDLKDLFFSNMSERAGKMMKEDMDAMGAVRLSDVDEAQIAIVHQAKALADAGEIIISSGEEEDQMIT